MYAHIYMFKFILVLNHVPKSRYKYAFSLNSFHQFSYIYMNTTLKMNTTQLPPSHTHACTQQFPTHRFMSLISFIAIILIHNHTRKKKTQNDTTHACILVLYDHSHTHVFLCLIFTSYNLMT